MLQWVKTKFFEYLSSLNYNVTDNGTHRDEFPWLMLRFNDANVSRTRDMNITEVRIIVDIFSTYDGEKEILDIIDNINEHIKEFIDSSDYIQYVSLRSLRIIDDPETGPVRKHGVANFQFTLTQGDEIEDGE